MKKISFLFLLLASVCHADEIGKKTRNAFTFSASTQSATNQAWQIYNSSNNRKHIYVEAIDIASQVAGYITLYTTPTATGYSGVASTITAVPARFGTGISTSTCKISGNASSPTGNIVWEGIILGSTTYRISNYDNPFQIPPGFALYAIKTQGANGKSVVSFFFREEPAP